MQEQRLWIADPKATHHVLQGSSDLYQRPARDREILAIVMDRGLLWSVGELLLTHRIVSPLIPSLGDVHKRQRRAMTPAFGLVEAKGLFPCFARCSHSVGHCYTHV